MTATEPPIWVQQPKQARSQRTLDALLDAAETLLEQRPWHDVAVTGIIKAAGASAGSFYGRFADKQALLHALHERLAGHTVAMSDWLRTAAARARAAEGASPTHADARNMARLVIGNIVRGHQRNRGVLRAVAIESFRDPRFAERALLAMTAMRDAGRAAMRPYRAALFPGITAEQFDENIAFALRMVLATLDQQLFVPPAASTRTDSLNDSALGAKLADAFIRQLQLE